MDVDGLLFLGAFIGALVGWIILVKRSFRQNILLGFATIVFWPITVFVLIKNWGLKDKDIKVPFFTTAVCVIPIVYVFGVHVPFIANHARDQIKPGQSVNQVIDVVTSYSKKPDLCSWRVKGDKDGFLSKRRECNFSSTKIALADNRKEFRLMVLFMGPGYLHNDFYVDFSSNGRVMSMSEVHHWD